MNHRNLEMTTTQRAPITAQLTDSEKRILYKAVRQHSGRTMCPFFSVEIQQQLTEILERIERALFNEISKSEAR